MASGDERTGRTNRIVLLYIHSEQLHGFRAEISGTGV